MIKSSPLFIQKIMTLVVFSLFFSFLASIFDVDDQVEGLSHQTSVLLILSVEILVGLIYFALLYFCLRRKHFARIILAILLILGILAYGLSLIATEYSMVQGIFYVVSIFLDIYILILLFGEEAKVFFEFVDVKKEIDGHYKTWFSTLSGLLLLAMIGAKFINKYELNHDSQHVDHEFLNEHSTDNISDASVKAVNREVSDTGIETSHAQLEELDCKDPQIIAEFASTMNNSPVILPFLIDLIIRKPRSLSLFKFRWFTIN